MSSERCQPYESRRPGRGGVTIRTGNVAFGAYLIAPRISPLPYVAL
jgi:hypothetical protein